MADLRINFAGIKSPNPFWLASAPPTNSGYQINRAFEAGWGGAVWKTLGGPIVNVNSRYGALSYRGQKVMGLNNIELISDRPIEVNLKEVTEVKRLWPDHAVIVSLMVESNQQAWHDIVKRTQDAGADGIELNFGCPHGMSERGMGSAVGQVPEYCQQITTWVMEAAQIPVIVKLTPNVGNILPPGMAAQAGGATSERSPAGRVRRPSVAGPTLHDHRAAAGNRVCQDSSRQRWRGVGESRWRTEPRAVTLQRSS